jgi:signal transduction histidine kinase
MDWIDEKISQLKGRLKKATLKKTLVIYMLTAIITVIISYLATIAFCEGWRELIYQKYSNTLKNEIVLRQIVDLQPLDVNLLLLFEFIESFSILIYSVVAISITSHLFYKNKIQEPINILKKEAKYISRNDVSFACSYDSGDEMGEICDAFDKMRIKLSENQEIIWNMMEDQRQLNAAFAHDLRTPLTVMQGYIEILVKYYPQGKISSDKLIETLLLMESQVSRLKNFSETMKGINALDSMEVKRKKNNLNLLGIKIYEIVNGLQINNSIKVNIDIKLTKEEAYFDEGIILQVLDNLISNALAYTISQIDIILENNNDMVFLYIRDNGNGFSERDLYSATRPYYSTRSDSVEHFGIGLTICKMLCEKHGGKLSLFNSIKGGAITCGSFSVI